MSKVILYCPEPLGLKLGPSVLPAEQIVFTDGFAVFDDADFPAWESWVKHPSSPPVEILPADSGQVPAGTPDAYHCAICDRAFTSKFALTGHLRSHAPKG